MQMEVKFQVYQLSCEAHEETREYPVGPQFLTPEEARDYLRTKIPTLLRIDNELSSAEDLWIYEMGQEDRFGDTFIIKAVVEGFPQSDLPWIGWLEAG